MSKLGGEIIKEEVKKNEVNLTAILKEIGEIEHSVDSCRARLFKISTEKFSPAQQAAYDKARHLLFEASSTLANMR
jgi:hypothetical protein